MTTKQSNSIRYISIAATDNDWGIALTTAGHQHIEPHQAYPPATHPDSYSFKPMQGRILQEYQLLYIAGGCGYFSSNSVKKCKVTAGTIIFLFPGEWHSYYPDDSTGWDEYWVGFQGDFIDMQVAKGFFSKAQPIYNIGFSAGIVQLYDEIIRHAQAEKPGFQQIMSGIVIHMLGWLYHKNRNSALDNPLDNAIVEQARELMRERVTQKCSPQRIASDLGVGYSKFRKLFKDYTGFSPAQYQAQLRIAKAKELLSSTNLNVSEIAYSLCFENVGQFSTFFHKHTGDTPSDFKKRLQ